MQLVTLTSVRCLCSNSGRGKTQVRIFWLWRPAMSVLRLHQFSSLATNTTINWTTSAACLRLVLYTCVEARKRTISCVTWLLVSQQLWKYLQPYAQSSKTSFIDWVSGLHFELIMITHNYFRLSVPPGCDFLLLPPSRGNITIKTLFNKKQKTKTATEDDTPNDPSRSRPLLIQKTKGCYCQWTGPLRLQGGGRGGRDHWVHVLYWEIPRKYNPWARGWVAGWVLVDQRSHRHMTYIERIRTRKLWFYKELQQNRPLRSSRVYNVFIMSWR